MGKLGQYLLPFLVVVGGAGLSGFICWQMDQNIRARLQDDFISLAREDFHSIHNTLQWHTEAVQTLGSYFLASSWVDRGEFETFVGPKLRSHGSFDGIGWIRRVEDAETLESVYARVKESHPSTTPMVFDADRGANDFLTQVEPYNLFGHLIGARVSSDPVFKDIARQAEIGRRAALFVRKLPLLGVSDRHDDLTAERRTTDNHLVMIYPAVRQDDKGAHVVGFAFSIIDLANIVEESLDHKNEKLIDAVIEADISGGGHQVIFTTGEGARAEKSSPYSYMQTIPIQEGSLSVTFTPRSEFLEERRDNSPWIMFVVLNAFTVVVAFAMMQTNRTMAEIHSAHARIKSILDTAGDAIITIDEKGNIQSYNRAAEVMFGYDSTEILGKNVSVLMPSPYQQEHDGYLASYMSGNPPKIIGIGRQAHAVRKDGQTFPIDLQVAEVKQSATRIFTGFVRDITKQKEDEAKIQQYTAGMEMQALALKAANIEAEKATKLKSEFLANMSHEIRTPMNGVIGMANLLLETKLDSTQRRYAEVVVNSADNLLQLVNDILDFSKIEAGKMELEIIPFDLFSLMEEVRELMSLKGNEKGVEIGMNFAPGTPRFVRGDPSRLRQIFLNLVNNAMKFTEKGHITISTEARGAGKDGATRFYASVEDTGIGIPLDKQDYIFNKFSQADESTTRKFGGTGLGLAICKQIASMMGGDIGVTSAPGQGSTFWFTFSMTEDREAAAGTSVSVPVQEQTIGRNEKEFVGVRVLLAEDNPTNQLVAMTMLEKFGCVVTVAGNGREAVDFVAQRNFDLIFMDCQMPEMDGYEAVGLIRKMEGEGHRRKTPVIAFTAYASAADAEKCRAAGMDDHITKPVRRAAMRGVLEKWAAICCATQDDFDAEVFDNLKLLMGDKFPDLVDKYIANSAKHIEQAERALANNDARLLAEAVHPLKSSSASLGLMNVSRIAGEIERHADEGNLSEVTPKVVELKDSFSGVEQILKTG
ncbi:MAG: ATP-binding protein [Alphaproteobacteria bacterium]